MKKRKTQNAKCKNACIICFFVVIIFILLFKNPAFAQENIQFFGSEQGAHEQDKDRNLLQCFKGLTRFLTPPNADFFEDFKDYWRDFFLWPSHYADVANIENQTNKARYAVISAFLRCDLDRLKSVTNAYYKLEAELYFVRHYVDTRGGYLRVLTELPGQRQDFMNQMMDYLILGRPSEDEEKDRALFSGYFDLFEAKYKERAKGYADFGDDPVFGELVAKISELLEGIKNLKKGDNELTKEFGELGKDIGKAAVEIGTSTFSKAVAAYKNPGTEIAGGLLDRFKICPETGDPDKCKNIYGAAKKVEDELLGIGKSFKKFSERKTFEEVQIAISQQKLKATEDETKGDMLARYELLYGQVSGDGVTDLMGRTDKLIAILGTSYDAGSLSPLSKIAECADRVQGNVCR